MPISLKHFILQYFASSVLCSKLNVSVYNVVIGNILCEKRMDLVVVVVGKSRKNVQAYILLSPDTQRAIDVLLETRTAPGMDIPKDNPYV